MANRKRRYQRRSRAWDMALTLTFFGVLAGVVSLLNAYNPQEFEGRAFAVDGDTIIMQEEKLRLSGIDAPELDQMCESQGKPYACGRQARDFLRSILRNGDTICRSGGFDRYDRWLVVCKNDGSDINAEMVAKGWAVDYGGYPSEEGKARREKLGIWSGKFENPSEFRHANRGDATAIKGSLSHGTVGMRAVIRALLK